MCRLRKASHPLPNSGARELGRVVGVIVLDGDSMQLGPSVVHAQPEHATGEWGVVIHPPTTLVSRVGQVCVPFKI